MQCGTISVSVHALKQAENSSVGEVPQALAEAEQVDDGDKIALMTRLSLLRFLM